MQSGTFLFLPLEIEKAASHPPLSKITGDQTLVLSVPSVSKGGPFSPNSSFDKDCLEIFIKNEKTGWVNEEA